MQQIQGGAPCDLFVSASKGNMDDLEKDGLIDTDSRKDLLGNTLALVATAETADKVSMDTLTTDDVKQIAIGEPETVPAGKYATQTFEALKITDKIDSKIIKAKDVRAVLNYVESGDAECGFVYRTDALMLDENYELAAQTLGSSQWKIFWTVLLPLARPGIVSGIVLTFARAMGEFGATLMLAGNIEGQTQTIPTAIYYAVATGKEQKANLLVLIITLFSFMVIFVLNMWLKKKNYKV